MTVEAVKWDRLRFLTWGVLLFPVLSGEGSGCLFEGGLGVG
jgi:hypothetical protein